LELGSVLKMTTQKEQYEQSLQRILQWAMELENLTDAQWKSIADETSALWKLKDEFGKILIIREEVRRNTYYQRFVTKPKEKRVVTAQEKAVDKNYICCGTCKRIVAKDYLTTHQRESKVCIDIRLALEMERRAIKTKKVATSVMKRFFEYYRKTYNVVNYLVENHLGKLKKHRQWIRKNGRDVPIVKDSGMYAYYETYNAVKYFTERHIVKLTSASLRK